MNCSNVVHVKFHDIVWPNGFKGPTAFEKDIRTEFLKDKNGEVFEHDDLVDIFKAYLQDEVSECPNSLEFSMN